MIELQHLSKVYSTPAGPVTVLNDINLQIAAGEIMGVIGRSGAGKSTLIRCVNLLERPTEGKVWVGGADLTSLSPRQLRSTRRNIGMVFQHFNLLSRRTVYDNIALPLELMGATTRLIRQKVLSLLELIHLSDKQNFYPAQLSGGQKQRVAIARALATDPKVLLCDEMTSALDPETTQSILQLVKSINQQLHLSVLLITHEMSVIKAIADRVAIIDQGAIVELSDVFSLFAKSKTEIALKFTQSALHAELPASITDKISKTPIAGGQELWRLTYAGSSVSEPIISQMIQNTGVHFNMLHANVEFLQEKPLGMLIAILDGQSEQLQQAQQFLQSKGLIIEVMGYVSSDLNIIS